MDISIAHLKRTLLQDIGDTSNDHYFHCKNSRQFQTNLITGALAFHSRNYKPIFIDNSDWIYCEFFNTGSSSLARFFQTKHLLNTISFVNFNVAIECFNLHKNDSEKYSKQIFCLQVDLSQGVLLGDSDTQQIDQLMNKESQKSIMKTSELLTFFMPISQNEHFNHVYKFQVVNKSSIFSMKCAQSRFKLRADIQIKLTDAKSNKSTTATLVFKSKSLFYYHFLYETCDYSLKCQQSVLLETASRADTFTLIPFDDESMAIELLPTINYKCSPSHHSDNRSTEETLETLCGVLLEKSILSRPANTRPLSKSVDDVALMNNFDILVPNEELKLLIRTNPSESHYDYVTIYFDTMLFLYPICALPGMRITITNVLRTSNGVFKAKMSSIKPGFFQDIDLFHHLKQQELANSRSDFLFTVLSNDIYNTKSLTNDNVFRMNLLFRNNSTASSYQVVAQVAKIYSFSIKMKCSVCNRMAKCCLCKASNFSFEFSATFQVDDHTSLIRLKYSNANYDLKSKHFNLLEPIAKYLEQILSNHLNEITLPSVPISYFNSKENSAEGPTTEVINELRRVLRQQQQESFSQTSEYSRNNITAMNMTTNDFQENEKLDILKTIYDYLLNNIIDSYYVFSIDVVSFKLHLIKRNLSLSKAINQSDSSYNNSNYNGNSSSFIPTVQCTAFRHIYE